MARATIGTDEDWLGDRIARLSGKAAIISVGAPTNAELKEIRHRVDDSLQATRAAMAEGIVAGGGAALLHAEPALDTLEVSGDYRIGVEIVRAALTEPVHLIASNAGYDGDDVVKQVTALGADEGFDALEGRFGNMVEHGHHRPAAGRALGAAERRVGGGADPHHQLAGGRGADAVEQGADDRVRAARRGHPAAVARTPARRSRWGSARRWADRCSPSGACPARWSTPRCTSGTPAPTTRPPPTARSTRWTCCAATASWTAAPCRRSRWSGSARPGCNRDVFDDGGVDRAVLQPVVLGDLFVLGFSPLEWHAEMAGLMPDRFVLSGELDPDGGQPGARGLTPRVRRFDLRGITLCERRRPAGSMRLADPWLRRTLARCGSAGADVVHIGVGPSTRAAPWARAGDGARIGARPTRRVGRQRRRPLVGRAARSRRIRRERPGGGSAGSAIGRDADCSRLPCGAGRSPRRRGGCRGCPRGPSRCGPGRRSRCGRAPRPASPRRGSTPASSASSRAALPEIRFVLGAGCLPTDELARLAVLPNVHVMLTEILPWAGSLEFAHAFGTLLAAFGAERLLFGSGYPMMRPGPLVRALATYRFPAEVSRRYPRFDAAAARAVLGGNAARLYRIPVEPAAATPAAAGA